jgi:pimeloyl-ACP methyl ester carboxylesterase
MTSPTEHRVTLNGVELCYFEWPGAEPAVFFAHATGFHARCWDQVVAQLNGRRAIAIDMRGHGRSEKPSTQGLSWRHFGADVSELVKLLELRGAIGVGHSMGGHSVTIAAATVPQAFAALLLLDPVILSKAAYANWNPGGTGEHFAARRRNEWASPDEMFERFKARNFASWDPAVLHDYCDHGLLPRADGGGFELACPPAFEAATYQMSADADIHDEIGRINIPVRVVRAHPRSGEVASDFSGSPTDPGIASAFRFGEDLPRPDLTHFIPMEAPSWVAQQIEDLISRVGEQPGPTAVPPFRNFTGV